MAHPYEARAELYRDAKNFTDTLGLRLRPLGIEYRIPLLHQHSARNLVDMKIEVVRSLTREVRKAVGQELYRAAFDGEAPEGFDWDQLDRDDLHKALTDNTDLKRRVEAKDGIIRRYRMFMEASGKNWSAIEKGGL